MPGNLPALKRPDTLRQRKSFPARYRHFRAVRFEEFFREILFFGEKSLRQVIRAATWLSFHPPKGNLDTAAAIP